MCSSIGGANNGRQIIKRGDKKYLLRVFMGRDPISGKRNYMNRTINGTKKLAEKELTAMLRAKDTGTLIEPSTHTLASYLDHWLEAAAKPRLRPGTFDEYEKQLKRYIYPVLGRAKLNQITPLAIQSLYGDMLTRGLFARTVRLTHAIFGNALKQAVKWRMMPYNPGDAVDLPKQQRNEMHAMSEEESLRFLAASEGGEWHNLFTLMLTTGLRPSEVTALRWTDLDLASGHLRVVQTVKRIKKQWVYQEPKTKGSRRTVDLPAGTVRMLADMQPECELVFHREYEPVRTRKVIENHFKPTLERAGLSQEIRLYDLRHTHATLLLIAGVHPKIVSERLGHSSIQITLDTYSHVLPTMQKESAAKLDAMLFSKDDTEGARAYN